MNKELLLAVKKQILAEPGQFIMDAFFATDQFSYPNCGTAACIAGWALAIHYKERPSKVREAIRNSGDYLENYGELGSRFLGITEEQAHTLFYEENWPEDLRQAWLNAYFLLDTNTKEKRAKIAAERIDRFIEAYDK